MIETLEELTQNWVDAKAAEQDANRERLSVEARILELCKDDIKEKGTTNLSTGIKIVTGYTEKWDQESVKELAECWYSDFPFPFKYEFKPVKAMMDVVKDCDNFNYKDIEKALTLAASKPSFSYVEKK